MNTPPTQTEQPQSPQMDRMKLALGCAGVSMVLCTGLIMLALIVMPVAFRSLPPEYQYKFSERLPFLKAFKPTEPPLAYLPTVAATSAAAMELLNTSSPNITPSPTQMVP